MEANTNVSRTQQLRTIREAFDSIPDLQDGWLDVRDRLFDMNMASERRHRHGAPSGMVHGISTQLAAKLFTVTHLIDGWQHPDKWTVDDILVIRNEVLYAQAYAKRFHNELSDWATKWAPMFTRQADGSLPIDYGKLMHQAVQS